MAADVLSDVLRAVHLTSVVYFNFELTSPWVLESPPAREIAATVIPGAQRVIGYHLMARGSAWANAAGDPPFRVREGDVLVFPQGHQHVMSSAPGMRVAPDMSAYARPRTGLPKVYRQGGGGEGARVVCCFLGCDDRPFNPLLSALPKMMHLAGSGGQAAAAGWLATAMDIAVAESCSGRAGSENVLARLSELLFVEAVRRHLETLSPSQTGWLGGLRDPVVGRALAALHSQPAEPWTVEGLAREVGVSRSVLAERFTEVVGQSPMQYLALWRMQLASRLLAEGAPVAAVAGAVGYESKAAFSRVFKKLAGQPPSRWRKGTPPSAG